MHAENDRHVRQVCDGVVQEPLEDIPLVIWLLGAPLKGFGVPFGLEAGLEFSKNHSKTFPWGSFKRASGLLSKGIGVDIRQV